MIKKNVNEVISRETVRPKAPNIILLRKLALIELMEQINDNLLFCCASTTSDEQEYVYIEKGSSVKFPTFKSAHN